MQSTLDLSQPPTHMTLENSFNRTQPFSTQALLRTADEGSKHLITKSNYYNHQAGTTKEDMLFEKYWLEAQNREVAEKRQNEEMMQTMNEWSKTKSRFWEHVSEK